MPIRAYLYDAEGQDREASFSPETVAGLGEQQLLWVDLTAADDEEVGRVAGALQLPPASVAHLRETHPRPRLDNYGRFFQFNLDAVEDATHGFRCQELDFIVAPNLVVTAHREPIDFLESFDRRVRGDTQLGALDAPAFLAALLDWHLTNFFRVIEKLEQQVDRLDDRAFQGRELLAELIALRKLVSAVRRSLTPHREIYAALIRPDVTLVAASDSAAHYGILHDRLERAIEAVENARELLVGSFDIYATQTAQRTNDIMRVLTVASVVLLPIGALAGVMGMNFKAKVFDTEDAGFWVVIGIMALISLATVLLARNRRWL